VPDLELSADIDVTDVLARLEQRGWSMTAMLVHACALALREVPRANGAYRDGHFELYARINVGVAVPAAETLTMPTVFDAEKKSLGALTEEIERLGRQARERTLAAPALTGATFTLWDAGALGIDRSTTVISPSQAAALAAGAVREAAVARGGQLSAGRLMTLTLVCDHRILYGDQAARFLRAIKSAFGA